MITTIEISNIKSEKLFFRELKVKRVGDGVYRIFAYEYGKPVVKHSGFAEDVAKYLNSHFGLKGEM